MEDLPLGRIEALVPEFAVRDLPLGRTLMMMMIIIMFKVNVSDMTPRTFMMHTEILGRSLQQSSFVALRVNRGL